MLALTGLQQAYGLLMIIAILSLAPLLLVVRQGLHRPLNHLEPGRGLRGNYEDQLYNNPQTHRRT